MKLTKGEFFTIIAIAVVSIVGVYVYFSGEPATGPMAYGDARDEQSQFASSSSDVAVSASSSTTNTLNQDKKIMNATFQTSKGEFTIEFFSDITPKTVENFVTLAKAGFYDGIKFHRVIEGFMIQGGDPLTKDDSMKPRWGTGGPGYTFADEITSQNNNEEGTVSMANAGPNTNGSQFFINVKDNGFLNDKHTVFAKVVSGMDVVKAIEGVNVDGSDRPIEPVVIQKVILR